MVTVCHGMSRSNSPNSILNRHKSYNMKPSLNYGVQVAVQVLQTTIVHLCSQADESCFIMVHPSFLLPCGKHGLLEAIHRFGNRGIFSRCNLRTGPDFPASQGACWGFVHRSWWGPVFGLVGFAACSWQSCCMLKTMGYDSNRMKI